MLLFTENLILTEAAHMLYEIASVCKTGFLGTVWLKNM